MSFTSKKGFSHTVMFVFVVFFGFVVALGYPQYEKYRDASHARKALSLARQLAGAQKVYQSQQQKYSSDWAMLGIKLPCKKEKNNFICYGYNLQEKDGNIVVEHMRFPQQFSINIQTLEATCHFTPGSWVGEELCRVTHL